jgi:hypothetical protein
MLRLRDPFDGFALGEKYYIVTLVPRSVDFIMFVWTDIFQSIIL